MCGACNFIRSLCVSQIESKKYTEHVTIYSIFYRSIFMMIFFCLLLSQAMTQLQIPQMLVNVFLGFTDNKYVVLLMVNVFLLFVGMIVNDTTAIMLCHSYFH